LFYFRFVLSLQKRDIIVNPQYNHLITSKLIKTTNLKPIELGMIYEIVFSKYLTNHKISINNLYIVNEEKQKIRKR
jgi:hypothetical protein